MNDKTETPQTEEAYDEILNEVLKNLRAEYRQDLPTRMNELNLAVQKANSEDDDSIDQLKTVHVLAHRLAGTAGSYGFQSLSAAAQELDLYLKVFFQADLSAHWRNDLDWQKIKSLTDKMQACINAD